MANPPKKKGTAGETELVRLLNSRLGDGAAGRRPAGSRYDIELWTFGQPVRVLATRPDRGQWLLTMSLEDFGDLMFHAPGFRAEIEVKRRKTFALHTMWDKEMDW